MVALLVLALATVLDPPRLLALRVGASSRDDKRDTLASRVEVTLGGGRRRDGAPGRAHAVSAGLVLVRVAVVNRRRRRRLRSGALRAGTPRSSGRSDGGNALSALDDSLLHRDRARDTVKLVVKATSVALGTTLLVTAPQRGGAGAAVSAAHANWSSRESVTSRGTARLQERLLRGIRVGRRRVRLLAIGGSTRSARLRVGLSTGCTTGG